MGDLGANSSQSLWGGIKDYFKSYDPVAYWADKFKGRVEKEGATPLPKPVVLPVWAMPLVIFGAVQGCNLDKRQTADDFRTSGCVERNYKGLDKTLDKLRAAGLSNREICSLLEMVDRVTDRTFATEEAYQILPELIELGLSEDQIRDHLEYVADRNRGITGLAYKIMPALLRAGFSVNQFCRLLGRIKGDPADLDDPVPAFEILPATVKEMQKNGLKTEEIYKILMSVAEAAKHDVGGAFAVLPGLLEAGVNYGLAGYAFKESAKAVEFKNLTAVYQATAELLKAGFYTDEICWFVDLSCLWHTAPDDESKISIYQALVEVAKELQAVDLERMFKLHYLQLVDDLPGGGMADNYRVLAQAIKALRATRIKYLAGGVISNVIANGGTRKFAACKALPDKIEELRSAGLSSEEIDKYLRKPDWLKRLNAK